ncbi:MAG: NFACT family protein [Candidatus Korarchaeota archaeon]
MSPLDIAIVVKELKSFLKCHVVNIYQIEEIFLFKLKCRESMFLLIEPGVRVHLTNYDISREKMPPGFCLQLRKHLKEMRLVDIFQLGLERTICMVFEGENSRKKLYVELMKNGVLALTDENDKVLLMTHDIKTSAREVMPGKQYIPLPPKPDIFSADEKELLAAKNEGFKKLLEYNFPLESLRLYDDPLLAREKTREAMERPLARIYFRENVPLGPYPFDIPGFDYKEFRTYNEACDEYFSKLLSTLLEEKQEEVIEVGEKKIKDIVERQRQHVKEMREAAEKAQQIAEILSAHIHEIRNAVEDILSRRRRGESWDSIKLSLPPPIIAVDEKKRNARILIEELTFEIDFGKDVMETMREYFQEARKIREKVSRAEEKLREIEEKIIREIEQPKVIKVSKRKLRMWFEKFKWFISSDGILVLAGFDATTNEILVKKYLSADEIFMHADIYGAPVVVIKSNSPSESTLQESAIFAASHSRAWKDSLASVDVYWVRGGQVSSSAPSGEYLKKGSFYIEGARNWIKHVPLKLAVAYVDNVVCCMPLQAIKKYASKIVVISPGKLKKSEAVKKIMEILQIPTEEESQLMRMLPPGECKIESITNGSGLGLPLPDEQKNPEEKTQEI